MIIVIDGGGDQIVIDNRPFAVHLGQVAQLAHLSLTEQEAGPAEQLEGDVRGGHRGEGWLD